MLVSISKSMINLFGCLLLLEISLAKILIFLCIGIRLPVLSGVKNYGILIFRMLVLFFVGAIFLDRLPIDEVFIQQCLFIVSRCYICNKAGESFSHIFVDCLYAKAIWNSISLKFRGQIDC